MGSGILGLLSLYSFAVRYVSHLKVRYSQRLRESKELVLVTSQIRLFFCYVVRDADTNKINILFSNSDKCY